MKIGYTLLLAIMFLGQDAYSQLIIPIKKCTRGKCYFVDQTNKRISDYYESVRSFKEELAPVMQEGKWGFVNRQMEMTIPMSYESVGDFENDITPVRLANEHFLINKKGERQGEIYDSIGIRKDYYVIQKGTKYGLMDKTGDIVEALRFDQISTLYKGDFGVKLNGKWANYNNGDLNYDNPQIYFGNPEQMPLFKKECLASEDRDTQYQCSERAMLETLNQSIRYPREARAKGIQGTVVVQFVINKEGKAQNTEIVKNVGGGCGEQALEVVKCYMSKWAYPGMEDGEPVNTVYNVPVKFELD